VSESPVAAYIGLGGNLGDPRQRLLDAFDALDRLPRSRLRARSALYRTAPVGPQDQPDYVNAAARLETELTPLELLEQLLEIEQRLGRVRDGRRWGPRVIDLDLLLHGDRALEHPRLRLPHPELHRRAFVLIPLAEVAPADLSIPGRGSRGALLDACDPAGVTALD
jgi:2-amino-4-hydroxy-6-hydroxymethyldihydropteridine diphosphokinase